MVCTKLFKVPWEHFILGKFCVNTCCTALWPDQKFELNELEMWLTDLWNELVLKFKKKFLGYVEPPPKWASSVAKSPGTRDGGRVSRQGKITKGDVTDWLSKAGKDAVYTSDDSRSMSSGLSAADRAAIFGLVDVVEKLSEDLRVVSFKVDALYKTTGAVNTSTIITHPFGVTEINGSSNAAENAATQEKEDPMDEMKQTERAWSVFCCITQLTICGCAHFMLLAGSKSDHKHGTTLRK
jgi:hypothetical protein